MLVHWNCVSEDVIETSLCRTRWILLSIAAAHFFVAIFVAVGIRMVTLYLCIIVEWSVGVVKVSRIITWSIAHRCLAKSRLAIPARSIVEGLLSTLASVQYILSLGWCWSLMIGLSLFRCEMIVIKKALRFHFLNCLRRWVKTTSFYWRCLSSTTYVQVRKSLLQPWR